jgi:hypothetical protein
MKLQMKRLAPGKLNRHANEMPAQGTPRIVHNNAAVSCTCAVHARSGRKVVVTD